MTRIIGEQTVNVAGQRPRDHKILQGVDFTMAMIHSKNDPTKPLLLVGVVDSVGNETAIPMEVEAVKRIANHMLEYARQMEC